MTERRCITPALMAAAEGLLDRMPLEARIAQLEADNRALMEVARHAIAMRSVVHDTDLCGLELEIAEQGLKDALDMAIEALPAHLKEEASK